MILNPRGFPLKKRIKETTTIYCYCSVGYSAIVTAYDDGRVKIEGDLDHPINEGALCSKGQAMSQVHQVDGKLNPYRLIGPLYRALNSADFEEKSWGWVAEKNCIACEWPAQADLKLFYGGCLYA